MVRRAATQCCDYNTDVLAAVQHRLAACDTTTAAKAYGAAKAGSAKREYVVDRDIGGDVDEVGAP